MHCGAFVRSIPGKHILIIDYVLSITLHTHNLVVLRSIRPYSVLQSDRIEHEGVGKTLSPGFVSAERGDTLFFVRSRAKGLAQDPAKRGVGTGCGYSVSTCSYGGAGDLQYGPTHLF